MAKNSIRLDFGSNPTLADALSRKEIGEKFTIGITAEITEKNATSVVGAITEIEVEDAEEEDEEIEPTGEEPVMAMVTAKEGNGGSSSF